VHIASAVFVFSHIAFDVLDHDDLRMKPSLLDSSIFKESIRRQDKDGSHSCVSVAGQHKR
jgi:hypothetical protein